MMADAASGRRVDPDTLSCQRSVEIIQSAQTCTFLARARLPGDFYDSTPPGGIGQDLGR